jgi:hypothetical protein
LAKLLFDNTIWRYTDQRGLTAIIADGKVMASNALYLNDVMEVKHARNPIYNGISNKIGVYTYLVSIELLGHVEAGAQIADYVFNHTLHVSVVKALAICSATGKGTGTAVSVMRSASSRKG